MNIYVQDDLAEQIKQLDDLNVSAICQEALRAEIDRRAELAKLDDGMTRHVVYIEELESDAAFTGREIWYRSTPPETGVYITRNHRIAIYDNDAGALYQFDSLDDMKADPAWRDGEPAMLAAVAQAFGEKHVIELDI